MAKKAKRVKGGEEFSAMLSTLSGDEAITVMRSACYAGIGVLADAINREIDNLPEQEGYMFGGRKRNVVTADEKRLLRERLGVSHIESNGDKADVVVSFAGYGDKPTKKYPRGVPIPLIARSIESGSSVREKNPFIRRAYNKSKSQAQSKAIDAGQEKINELIK